MTLASIYADYVRKEEKDRHPLRLFVSDVGKCPREVAYRMMGADTDPSTPEQDINRLIMWSEAEFLEQTLWEALQAAHFAIAYQDDVDINDRDNWGGRFDIIADYGGRRIIEVKSLHPNNFRYDIEKPAHHHQARIYHNYCRYEYGLTASPLLWYVDRGGSNTPQEIDASVSWGESSDLMDELEAARNNLPELPERLSKKLFLRSAGKQIKCEPDPRCRQPYCKYTLTCCQDMSTSVWATRSSVELPWELKTKAIDDYNMLGDFIDSLLLPFGTKQQ